MRPIDCDFVSLTLTLPRPKDELEKVLLALTHQSKNLANTCLFVIRNAFTAYKYDKETGLNVLKKELHSHQIDIIDHYNIHIALINKKRIDKHPAFIQKELAKGKALEDIREAKLIPLLAPVLSNLAAVLLDSTLLDNVVKTWSNEKHDIVYKRIPAVMAQQNLATIKDNFSSYFNAAKQYGKNPASMTGRPRMPKYHDKQGRAALEIPLVAVRTHLPALKGKVVYEDYQENNQLDPELLEVFSRFSVDEMVKKACQKRGWTDYKAQHLRIVPLKKGLKMEVVVRVKNAYPERSFLATIYQDHKDTLAAFKKPKEYSTWLLNHLKELPADQLPNICGIDLGIKNVGTLSYSTGHKAEVHSGAVINKTLGRLNYKIDSFLSSQASPRAKELQAKQAELAKKAERLTTEEHNELKKLQAAVYGHDTYQRLSNYKRQWLQNYLHQLSHGIIKNCVAKKIDVIVIGKNLGWKQEINLGKKTNRSFCQVAHATLIEYLTYKAELQGIAVVTTEESYTSQTSFVDNEELSIYDETPSTPEAKALRPAKAGKRSTVNRNWFIHKNRVDRLKIVHADVNGAFNIIRKVFKNFAYHVKLTLKFTIYTMNSKQGVLKLQL